MEPAADGKSYPIPRQFPTPNLELRPTAVPVRRRLTEQMCTEMYAGAQTKGRSGHSLLVRITVWNLTVYQAPSAALPMPENSKARWHRRDRCIPT